MRAAVFLAAVLVAFPATAGDDAAASIKANCKAQWAGKYRMQKFCIEQQSKAAARVEGLMKTYAAGTEERRIIERCETKWPGRVAGLNFDMVAFCADEELKAYNELK